MENITKEKSVPLLIFSGPSGVGKGTLLKRFMSEFAENCKMSVSWTTRDPRHGEKEGKEYYFKKMEEFEEVIFIFNKNCKN